MNTVLCGKDRIEHPGHILDLAEVQYLGEAQLKDDYAPHLDRDRRIRLLVAGCSHLVSGHGPAILETHLERRV